jgi:flagellar biosynthetic protein FlhB
VAAGTQASSILTDRLAAGIGQAVWLVVPLGLTVMIAGVAANLAAGGFLISFSAIRFDGSRMNPSKGLKRLVDKSAMVRLLISLAKLVILAGVTWIVVAGRLDSFLSMRSASAESIAGSAMAAILELGITVALLLSIVALADMVMQRRKAKGSIQMSKQEVKQEYKESEGDPMIRGQRRRRARQMAFSRMMDAIPSADVIVVNPIRLAVALKYDSLTMPAPRIVAKGQRLVAARIRDLAKANGVPIVEDVPLARALFTRPVGADVPAHLYRAVARLLVLVQQARFGYAGGTPRPAANPTTPAPRAAIPAWLSPARTRPEELA